MQLSERRYGYIDIARGIAIILVVCGHLLDNDSVIKRVIYSFHMPLFFVISGMLLSPKPVFTKLKNRIQDVIVPYFVWAMIFAGFSFKNLFFALYGTNESLVKVNANGMLWFLPCMFFSSVFAQALINFTSGKAYKYRILAVCGALTLIMSSVMNIFHSRIVIHNMSLGYPFGLDIVLLSVSYMIFGYLLRCKTEKKI